MTTKEYLGQIFRFEKMIKIKLTEIYQLKTMATSVTISYENDRVQTSNKKDRMANAVGKLVDLENETSEMLNDCMETRKTIISQIENIGDSRLYYILAAKYIEGKTLQEIGDDMTYTKRQTIRLHKKALSEFENKYGETYLDSVLEK